MQKTPAKSLESWIWTAACSIRGARGAAKYKDYILPLIFTKRLCDVFDGDFNATTRGQRDPDDDRLSNLIEAISTKGLGLADVEAYIIGRSYEPRGARQTARQDSPKGERGSANQYLLRKLAEGSGQSIGKWSGATWTTRQGRPEGERAGVHAFDTRPEVGAVMVLIPDSRPGMEGYDPPCVSGGLILRCQNGTEQQERGLSSPRGGEKEAVCHARTEGGHSCPPDPVAGWKTRAPLKLYAPEKRASAARSGQPQRAPMVRPRRKRPHQYTAEARVIPEPTLDRNTFSSIALPLPSPKDPQQIADALDLVELGTAAAERKKVHLQELFPTLLHELMTAKTRLHEVAPTA